MFATFKGLESKLNREIEVMNLNIAVFNGEVENVNGYSQEYILDVIRSQVGTVTAIEDRIESDSCDDKLKARIHRKAKKAREAYAKIEFREFI